MMRKSLALAALILILARQLRADDAADDQAFFDKQVSKFVKLQPKRLTADAVAAVFSAPFYNVTILGNDGSSTTAVVARVGDDISMVTIPSSSADMPDFVKLIKPAFILKSDADAKVFQDALDVLYPIDPTMNKDDLAVKGIRHNGNTFTFVRGKFFDHFRGFIVATDDQGKIISIKYSLDDIK
jgi:hypothetical protein